MAGIVSIGWHLPAARQSVDEVAAEHGVSAAVLRDFGLEWKVKPGPDDHPSSFAARAAKAALDAAGMTANDLDLLIFTGTTRDRPPPWVAAFGVLHELGASRAAGFDLSGRCPGVGDALWVAASLVRAGSFRNAVVCSGDRFDYLTQPSAAAPSLANAIFAAGGAAAVVSGAADNQIAARAHYTREGVADHDSHVPRAGGSRWPVDERALAERAHLMSDDETIPQVAAMRAYFRRAEKQTIAAVMEQAGFDGLDFIAGSTFYVKDQIAAFAKMGIGPDKFQMIMPQLGHVGSSSSLISVGTAIQEGRRVGPRLILNLRTYFYCNALAIRGSAPDLGIRVSGPPRRAEAA
jgi:3-oxoacyl-[acyl-carrier-protein] synthase III